jgi:pyruvate dehydrogenase E1 component alpha subunit
MGTRIDRALSQVDVSAHAGSYGLTSASVDGMDVLAVAEAAGAAAARIRAGAGPQFLEMRTYRFRAHSMFDAELYREKAEVEQWKLRDPILLFGERLEHDGLIDPAVRSAIDADVEAEVARAVAFAEAGTWEPVEQLTRDVCTGRSSS